MHKVGSRDIIGMLVSTNSCGPGVSLAYSICYSRVTSLDLVRVDITFSYAWKYFIKWFSILRGLGARKNNSNM